MYTEKGSWRASQVELSGKQTKYNNKKIYKMKIIIFDNIPNKTITTEKT
jgi:hypothetical protein